MTGQVDNLLVSLSGDVAIDRIVDFVIELVGGRDIGVTLFLAQEPEVGGTDERLDAVATRLRNTGITVKTVITEEPPFKTLMT